MSIERNANVSARTTPTEMRTPQGAPEGVAELIKKLNAASRPVNVSGEPTTIEQETSDTDHATTVYTRKTPTRYPGAITIKSL